MTKSEPLVYIVILSWNAEHDLRRCLDSISQLTYYHTRVVVVDNASDDGSAAMVRMQFPHHKLIVNQVNLGFSAGCNVGLRHALNQNADYVLVLNQDTILAPDFMEACLLQMADNAKIALIGPKTYFLEEEASNVNGFPPRGRRLLYTGAFQRWLPLEQYIPNIGKFDLGESDQPQVTDYAWGHALFARGTVLREIGLFDEAFFMYNEDLDLCRRALLAGYTVQYVPQAIVWHDATDGDRRENFEVWRWQYKLSSMRIFYRKHYGFLKGELLSLVNLVYLSLRFFKNGYHSASLKLYPVWLMTFVPSIAASPRVK